MINSADNMSSPPLPKFQPVAFVSKDIIRDIFNSGQYWERLRTGELEADVRKEGHPDSLHSGEPPCTKSQYVVYRDPKGNIVASVHQYLRPDGSLGASGKPDPKRIYMPNKTVAVRAK